MRFGYRALPTRRAVPSLGGTSIRHRPLLTIDVIGPGGSHLMIGALDTGSDDTLFPLSLANRLGIDLSGAEEGESRGVGGTPIPYRFASVTLRVADSSEAYQWQAIVGFIDSPIRWAILGHAGMLQYFDVQLFGARRELVLIPNLSFPGTRSTNRPTAP